MRPDPFVKEVFARNQATKKPWVKAEPCSHLWVARLPADLEVGTHCIKVRAVDEYGREHATISCLRSPAPTHTANLELGRRIPASAHSSFFRGGGRREGAQARA